MSKALGEKFDLICCTSSEEARSPLAGRAEVIICGTHFDECRMFDLLRYAKADPGTRRIPFLCIRVIEGGLDDTLYQSVDIATKALGAAGFIDLLRWETKFGVQEAHQRLRNLVDELAGSVSDD